MQYASSLHLFQRDLRLDDNHTLNQALARSQAVLPCFILDRHLLQTLGALPRVKYLLASLRDLDIALRARGSRLHVIHDAPTDGLTRLLAVSHANAVFHHHDATPYARCRQQRIDQICRDNGIGHEAVDDITLHPPSVTLKPDGTPYTVFTPFHRRAQLLPVARPAALAKGQLTSLPGEQYSLDTALSAAGLVLAADCQPAAETKALLRSLSHLKDYQHSRDVPAIAGTSRLSAALRFGVISSREAWWAMASSLGNEHPLLRQLFWRDFFFSIAHYFPRVFSGAFQQQYRHMRWPDNPAWLQAWQEGRTGFPIVDAGLRELAATGYMHNRVRMITASFLVKDLHCDWRHGERHFARQLIDYDPCINNGNWQWAASTGCDAQPYFRIFNPWSQQQKFDPDCTYVKRWLPELEKVPPKTLHNLFKLDDALPGYVRPVVDHATQSMLAKQFFESVRRQT